MVHARFVGSSLLLVAVCLVGCSPIHATAARTGKVFPSLPPDCPIRFENISHAEASNQYEQVGLVTLTGTSDQPQSWEGETRDLLAPKVCEIGGSIVTMNASFGGDTRMGTGMIQFVVWRERPAVQSSGSAPAPQAQ